MPITGEELRQALDHDAAIKSSVNRSEPRSTFPVSSALVPSIETKQAALAKALSLRFIDLAQRCALRALGATHNKPIDMDKIQSYLDIAGIALDLAAKADILGDKSVIRVQGLKHES